MALPKLFDFITIRNRKEIEIDGIKLLDFTDPVVVFKSRLRFSRPPIIVPKEFEGRGDLVAKSAYGSEDHTDLFMLFNGFSNPLVVQEGMVLVVPDLDSMIANTQDNQEVDTDNKSKKNFNKKISKKDKDRITQVIAKSRGITPEEVDIRPPNAVKDGSEPIIPADGKIVLGTNVSDSRCTDQLSEIQNLSEIIRQAVKDKISKITPLVTASVPSTGSSSPSPQV